MKKSTKTIVTLAGLTLTAIHVLNRIQYARCLSGNVLACPENNYYEWRFGKIRYTRQGTGTPVLLLHGLDVGSSSHEFNKIKTLLARDYQVYTMDLLGYGLSDKPNMTYTCYLYVQLISDFVKNVIRKKTDVVAVGGMAPVCIMTCRNDPEIFRKITLINPEDIYKLNEIPSKGTKIMKHIFELPVIGTYAYNILTCKKAFEKTFREKYFAAPDKVDENDILAYMEAAHTPDFTSKFSHASRVGNYMNCNILHALQETENSILIIGGREEDAIKTVIDNYRYFNQAILFFLIDKTRHLPHMEKPQKVADLLKSYLG